MKKLTDVTSKVFGTGRTVFLAGLGLTAVVTDQTKKAFDSLVEKGQARSEMAGESKVKATVERASERIKGFAEMASSRAKGGIASGISRLGIPSANEINELKRSVEQLTEKVKTLQTV